jgi:hypothetical protein
MNVAERRFFGRLTCRAEFCEDVFVSKRRQFHSSEGGEAMASIRRTGWFLVLALVMAGWMGVLGSFRGVAEAGVIASHGGGPDDLRAADVATMQAFLEQKVVLQQLMDYGVSPEEAMAKVRSMSDRDLHRLASLTDRAAAGSDRALGILIGVAILVILVIVIMKLMNKEIVIR